MAVAQSKLGSNPLSRGVFSKTSEDTGGVTGKNIQESRKKNEDTPFLRAGSREKVNLRLPLELNDWLDSLLKQGKRTYGQKIPKEVWVQAALELLRAMPVDWSEVGSKQDLEGQLLRLEKIINKEDS